MRPSHILGTSFAVHLPYKGRSTNATRCTSSTSTPSSTMSVCLRCQINKWMRARGWSDEQVAAHIGAPQHAVTLNRWRRGKMTLDDVPDLKQALHGLLVGKGEVAS